MKRKNIDKHLNRLSKIMNRYPKDLERILNLVDNKMYKLVEICQRIKNGCYIGLPYDQEDLNNKKFTTLTKATPYIDLSNFFTQKKIWSIWDESYQERKRLNHARGIYQNGIQLRTEDNPLESLQKRDKLSRKHQQEHYDNIHVNRLLNHKKYKKKQMRKSKKEPRIRKSSPHTTQSKLICIQNIETNEIIRIRKDSIKEEVQNRNFGPWKYTTKTEFKIQQNKYKIGKLYEEHKNNKDFIKKVFPFKNMFNKTYNINLLRAFCVNKDQIIELPEGTKIKSIITPEGNNIVSYKKETKQHKSKDYKKKVWITKDKFKDIEITRKINGKLVTTTKKKKIKILIEKKIITIKGKITEIKIPIFIKATKYISSIYNIASSKWNIKENCINKINHKKYSKIIKK